MKGRNGSTSFLPLLNKGGLNNKVKSEVCLTKDQAKQVYSKIESGDKFKIRKTILQHSNPKLPKQVKERKDVNKIVTLLGKRSFISRSSTGGQSSFRVQTTWLVFNSVKLLEVYSAYFGRYSRNWLSFTAVQRAYLFEMINLMGHMPRLTLKMNIFPSISLEMP